MPMFEGASLLPQLSSTKTATPRASFRKFTDSSCRLHDCVIIPLGSHKAMPVYPGCHRPRASPVALWIQRIDTRRVRYVPQEHLVSLLDANSTARPSAQVRPHPPLFGRGYPRLLPRRGAPVRITLGLAGRDCHYLGEGCKIHATGSSESLERCRLGTL